MDVREMLRKKVTVMVVIPLAVIAVAAAIWQSTSGSRSYMQVGKSFYTDDDGVSYFIDASDKIMPFQHNGREAVRAAVYAGADGKPFVAYLMRYTAMARREYQAAQARGETHLTVSVSPMMEAKPARSTATWVPDTDPRFQTITNPAADTKEPLKAVSPAQ